MLCSYLHKAEDIKYVVKSQYAVIYSHQTTQPGGGGHQQQQEGIADSGAAERQTEAKRAVEEKKD